ncbi:hypothetical protein Phum_PHUM146130 [Pediculus humanus corporis]|uniref:Uncharacterized protein n=1 Tax=Pediculus humanus subsp. corporis TaxID=121224 RepID=E0VEW4_PEDHC|nr:uncharacterized protein Phum_PHUM146130 [Pediculus humanus corporis]EEB11938.1 hypothetical protein Phum_PHUM146130 [Pediculus humanus corporis]
MKTGTSVLVILSAYVCAVFAAFDQCPIDAKCCPLESGQCSIDSTHCLLNSNCSPFITMRSTDDHFSTSSRVLNPFLSFTEISN